jgi:PAS domain S-box-containing protein
MSAPLDEVFMSVGAKIGAGFLAGLLIVAAIGLSAYVSTQRLIEQNRWVTHTHQAIQNLEHVLSTLKDAETGQRGFLLIGKDRYLEPYNAATTEIQRGIDAVAELTRNNPTQQESLKQAKKLSGDKLAELRETIDARKKSGLDAALLIVGSDRGKQIMDQLRSVVAEMEQRERQLLDQRQEAADAAANHTLWTITVWMPIGLLLLAVAAVVLMRTVQFGGPEALPAAPTKWKKWSDLAIRYISAVVLVAIGVVLRMRLMDSFGPLPTFVTLYPAVILAASLGGGGPGIVATILSALAADYWFFPPYGSFSVSAPNHVLALGIFTGSSLFISVLAERVRRARWAEAVNLAQQRQMAELSRLNEQLSEQAEELSHQSEELTRQNEELSQQSEELSQQSEELAQQNEEQQTQAEEIQALNTELAHREDMLQKLLDAARLGTAEQSVIQDVCAAAQTMFGPPAAAVVVYEVQGDRLAVLAQAGLGAEGADLPPRLLEHSFAELVLAEKKTACLPDVSLRPDLSILIASGQQPFQSVLAAPMRCVRGDSVGVVAVYSRQKHDWTAEQFRLADWLAAQCRHILETLRLQEQTRRQADLIDLSPDAIIVRKLDGTITFWSRGAETLYGWTRQEAIGRCTHDLFQTQFPEPLEQIVAQLQYSGRWSGELLHRAKDGRQVTVQSWWLGQLDANGAVTDILESNVDMTERKRAEEAIRAGQRQNEFLAGIIQRSSQPFGVGYSNGRLGLINSAFEQLTGYTADELRSIDWATALTPPEWQQIEAAKLDELQRTGLPVRYEKEYIRKDGSRVPIELLVHIVREDGSGKPLYYYSFITDVTERRRAEEELRANNDELTRFNNVAVGRELRMIELKQEINALCDQLGQPPHYPLPATEEQP